MRRAIIGLFIVGALAAAPVSAQSPSPMPWVEYRAAAQAFEDVLQAPRDPLTLETLMPRFEEMMALYRGESDRLAAISPEPCYAAAHDEYAAYWRDYIANTDDARPMFEAADSVMGILPIAMMIETVMAAAHPAAYADDASNAFLGKRLDRMRILDTLQTCVPLASPVP